MSGYAVNVVKCIIFVNVFTTKFLLMKKNITLKKGLNLNLAGSVRRPDVTEVKVTRVAVTPDDFPGFVPKLDVQPGDVVKAGQPLLHDKNAEAMKLCSPVAGKVAEVVRGARRKIERVVVECDAAGEAVTLPADMQVKELILASGLWPWMRQRPYDIVPSPDVKPRDIFVTALDTAPLAPDYAMPAAEVLAAGVKALASLTDGKVYIGVASDSDFPEVTGAVTVGFNRLHPAGNAGVQAANIAPVNKGEVIWTLSLDTLARIGSLMLDRRADFSATVALTGSEVTDPCMLKTVAGAEIKPLVEGRLAADGHKRIISGNVLTGVPVGEEGYLRFPYRQITVIPEGDDADEFMGWASMSPSKLSESRSFPGHFSGKEFAPDARLNGGRRAMIMSGVYDKYMPMDILPEYLVKAILSRDIDKMEALGIYEVAPEDFALAEYADPSKLELQQIVRDGLEYLRKEV